MTSINAYLHFMGNAEKALSFYKSVLGGEFTALQRYKDVAGSEKMNTEDQNKIMHISLSAQNGITIMATDALESMGNKIEFGNNFYLCVNTESEAEADKLFEGFTMGGKVEMPMNKTFWGAYFGMCQDQFGVRWMINFTYTQNA